MVSLGMIFRRYKYFFLLASLFVLGGAAQSSAALIDTSTIKWACIIGQTKCCVNGAQSCCDDDGTVYDTSSCSDECEIVGAKQYKYTADSTCGYSTSTRTCCSSGSWSDWDAACPKTCSSSSKPDTKTTCTGGYKTRIVTCDTSTGEWATGAWGDCDCSASGYETVYLKDGSPCCQSTSDTGIKCATTAIVGLRWVSMGYTCADKAECGFGCSSVSGGASCSNENEWCSAWISGSSAANFTAGCGGQFESINGRGGCMQYMCRY